MPRRSAAAAAEEPSPDLTSPSLYLNRELSLLAFQRRVLEEAENPANPLLERVKFLSILASNIDEFFMVRVAVLRGKLDPKLAGDAAAVESITMELRAIREDVLRLLAGAYELLHGAIIPELAAAGIAVVDYAALSREQKEEADRYFHYNVFPLLTPLAIDQGRPFPHISNLSLNIALVIRDTKGELRYGRVKVPDTIPRLVSVSPKPHAFVWMEQVIAANLDRLFPHMEIVESHAFHVTRDAELVIQELESDDLLETIEEAAWQRRFRAVVRLKVDSHIPSHMLDFLVENLDILPDDVYRVNGPIDLKRLRDLLDLDRPDLKEPPHSPAAWPSARADRRKPIIDLIRVGDRLLHHPFQSFQPVVDFLREAAADPQVLAIKMTLYRVGRNSPIVEALIAANENGKQVAVLVELKARFDEESNIEWAQALEREGVHVVYGLPGLKVHSKIALVVRREGDAIRRYVHLGTGNYNPVTGKLYTDISFFTCDPAIGEDASDLFNYLTGYSAKQSFAKLLVAPINLRARLEQLIRREIAKSTAKNRGHIILKANAIEDSAMIELLYEASRAGVKVDLIVRGICCLRPGLAGVSENIRVRSVVGRFLEHSRIFYFRNGGTEEVYCGSADLMPRNLNRRVEIVFPVENPKLVRRIRDEILANYLADNVKARAMDSGGGYTVADRGSAKPFDSQTWLMKKHQ